MRCLFLLWAKTISRITLGSSLQLPRDSLTLEADPILNTGESVTYENVTVKVISLGIQDKIQITKKS